MYKLYNIKSYNIIQLCKLRTNLQIIAFIKAKTMGIKPGPKRIADSTGKPDRRQRDTKKHSINTKKETNWGVNIVSAYIFKYMYFVFLSHLDRYVVQILRTLSAKFERI